MLHRLRTIAILMLLAGASLGVFAGRLIAFRTTGDEDPNVSKQVDESLRLYRERYDLTDAQAEEIRGALAERYRRIQDKLAELRRENEMKFRAISTETEQKIRAVLEQAGR